MIGKSTFLLFVSFIFLTFQVSAQIELDTTFGSTGKFIVLTGISGTPADMKILPDNRVIMVGSCAAIYNGATIVCVARLNEDGSLDTTLHGMNGDIPVNYVLTNIPGTRPGTTQDQVNYSSGIVLLNDGKFIVAGVATINNEERMFLIRYNQDGIQDASFGTNGIATYSINSGGSRASKVVIQPNGKIVIVGYSGSSTTNKKQVVVRFNSDGSFDTSFGNGGVVTVEIPDNYTLGASIALQNDGKILTGGYMTNVPGPPSSNTFYLLTRFNSDGTLDTTFDGDGFKTIPFVTTGTYYQGFNKLALQTDGRILALGYSNILYRFNTDGSLDTSFDGDGSRPALNGSSNANDLTVTPSGKITVVGQTPVNTFVYNYRTARYLPDGSPDTSYGNGGNLDINIESGKQHAARVVAFDTVGRIVVGGISAQGTVQNPYSTPNFSIARLKAVPIQNVAIAGRITKADGRYVINGFVTIKLGNQIIANGRTNSIGYYHFQNIPSGQTYTISVRAKNLVFNDSSLLVDDEIKALNISAAQTSFAQINGKQAIARK